MLLILMCTASLHLAVTFRRCMEQVMATKVSKVQECPIVMGSSDHFTLNTECGNKGNKLKSCLLLVLLLLSLFPSNCIGLAYGAVT